MLCATRREFAAATLAFGALAMPLHAQDAYPSDTVTLLIPWAAGGATDVAARAIQPTLAEQLGTDVIIKNVSGAAGTIGTAEAARARPDGYTVLVTSAGPVAVQPHLRKLPYDLDSFKPVGRVSLTPMLTMVPQDSPYNTIEELIAAAKENPGQITAGSSGAGTLPHLAILALNKAAGIELKHIPFQGSNAAIKELLGGTVALFSDQSQSAPKYELNGLLAWSGERLEEYPDVPTMKDLGYDIEMGNWIGVFVPLDTPEEIATALNEALNNTLNDPEVLQNFADLLLAPSPTSIEEFDAFARANYEFSREMLQDAGLVQ